MALLSYGATAGGTLALLLLAPGSPGWLFWAYVLPFGLTLGARGPIVGPCPGYSIDMTANDRLDCGDVNPVDGDFDQIVRASYEGRFTGRKLAGRGPYRKVVIPEDCRERSDGSPFVCRL